MRTGDAANDFQARLDILLAQVRPGEHPALTFRGVTDDAFWLWINTDGRDANVALAEKLPGLPGEEMQRRWTGKTAAATEAEGFRIYRVMRDLHVRHRGDLRECGLVLDFGCGWGRVIRYFLKDVDPGQLIGTDHDDANIAFCVVSNPWCVFIRNEAAPPLPLADHSVGYVYAYSVFSHFSEPMRQLWLNEFKRILRPGGALALTVRPRRFIEKCAAVRRGEATATAPISVRMFPDAQASLDAYDERGFAFSPYRAGDEDAWWGEACISRAYIEREWAKQFVVVAFDAADERSFLRRRLGRNGVALKQHVVLLGA